MSKDQISNQNLRSNRRFGTDISNMIGENQPQQNLKQQKSSRDIIQKNNSKPNNKEPSNYSQCVETSTHMMIESTPHNIALEDQQTNQFHSAQLSHNFDLVGQPDGAVKSLRQAQCSSSEIEKNNQQRQHRDFTKNRSEEIMIEETNSLKIHNEPRTASAPDFGSLAKNQMQCENINTFKNNDQIDDPDTPFEIRNFDQKNIHLPQMTPEFIQTIFSFLKSSEVSISFFLLPSFFHWLIL